MLPRCKQKSKGGDLRTSEAAGDLCLADIFVIAKLSGGFLFRLFALLLLPQLFMMLYNYNNSWLKNSISYNYKKCHASLEGRCKQNIKYLTSTIIQ